jgi:hypothetical protein
MNNYKELEMQMKQKDVPYELKLNIMNYLEGESNGYYYTYHNYSNILY